MPSSFLKKKPDHFDYALERVCKNCSNSFSGRFCNRCGEKVFDPSERSILNFLAGLLNAFTFLEGKFIKSLKVLFTRPGILSRNIADGHQVPFMKMISLFFVANFFYFLFPIFDSFNSSLHTQMNLLGGHSEKVTRIVNETLAQKGIALEEFRQDYQSQSTNISKLLIIFLVIMFSFFLAITNYSRKNYYYEHLLVSLEYYSYLILAMLLLIPHIFLPIIKVALSYGQDLRWLLSDDFYLYVMVVVLGYFLFRVQRNFYSQKWYWALPKTILLLLLMRESWNAYRKLLFYITMWWMD